MSNLKKILQIVIAVFVIVVLPLSTQSETKLKKYSEKIYLDQSGNIEAVVELTVKTDSSSSVLLPLNIGKNAELLITDGNLKDVQIVNREGVNYIIAIAPGLFDSLKVYKFCIAVKKFFDYEKNKSEFGNYLFSYNFINTCPAKIDRFESSIFLPEGYVVNAVMETNPKAKNNNPEFPYELGRENGKNYFKLKNSKMDIGDYSSMKFRFKSEKKPIILLVFLTLIAAGYLVLFRDLINKKMKK